MECIQSIERIEPCQKQERKPTWIIQRISRNFRQNEIERKYISLVSIQQHLSMKVLFLQMVLAFAKLQYYIPGKSLNKNFRRLFVSLPQFLGYFNDPAINNNIVINGFIDH